MSVSSKVSHCSGDAVSGATVGECDVVYPSTHYHYVIPTTRGATGYFRQPLFFHKTHKRRQPH